jgi:hypothetical protein
MKRFAFLLILLSACLLTEIVGWAEHRSTDSVIHEQTIATTAVGLADVRCPSSASASSAARAGLAVPSREKGVPTAVSCQADRQSGSRLPLFAKALYPGKTRAIISAISYLPEFSLVMWSIAIAAPSNRGGSVISEPLGLFGAYRHQFACAFRGFQFFDHAVCYTPDKWNRDGGSRSTLDLREERKLSGGFYEVHSPCDEQEDRYPP